MYTYIYTYLCLSIMVPVKTQTPRPKKTFPQVQVSSLPRLPGHGVLKLLQHRALTGSPNEFQALLVQLDHHDVRVHRRNGRDHVALLTVLKDLRGFLLAVDDIPNYVISYLYNIV